MKLILCISSILLCFVLVNGKQKRQSDFKTEIKSLKPTDSTKDVTDPTDSSDNDDDDDLDENDKFEVDDIDDDDELNKDCKESAREFNKLVDLQVTLKNRINSLKSLLGVTAPKATLDDIIEELEKQYPNADFDIQENNGNITVEVSMDNNAPVPQKLSEAVDILNGVKQTTQQIKQQVKITEKIIRKVTSRNESRSIMTLTRNSTNAVRTNFARINRAHALTAMAQRNILAIDQSLENGIQTLVRNQTGNKNGNSASLVVFEKITLVCLLMVIGLVRTC